MAPLNEFHNSPLARAWLACGAMLIVGAAVLSWFSHNFNYDYAVIEMPILPLAAALILAGSFFVASIPLLIEKSQRLDSNLEHAILLWMLIAGLFMRLALMPSEPILEDDYQRYLLDGALVAHGFNPFAISPSDLLNLDPSTKLGALIAEGQVTVERVNHPELRTIYPPVGQAWFAVAHILSPWSLVSWRFVLLGLEGVTIAIVIILLRDTGRSPLWAALYWWNPLVLKELANSAHMEPAILAPLMLALLMAARKRYVLATVSLAIAAGAKLWPAMLLPLILRPLINEPRRLMIALAAFAGLAALFAAPVLLTELDSKSGFHAYASHWQTNSAFFPLLKELFATVLAALGVTAISPGLAARLFAAACIGTAVLMLSIKRIDNTDDLIGRVSMVIAALLLLAPAQFPWYMTWFAPLLAFRPWHGMVLMAVTLPIYYISFHFSSREQLDVYRDGIVYVVWLPIWGAILFEYFAAKPRTAARA